MESFKSKGDVDVEKPFSKNGDSLGKNPGKKVIFAANIEYEPPKKPRIAFQSRKMPTKFDKMSVSEISIHYRNVKHSVTRVKLWSLALIVISLSTLGFGIFYDLSHINISQSVFGFLFAMAGMAGFISARRLNVSIAQGYFLFLVVCIIFDALVSAIVYLMPEASKTCDDEVCEAQKNVTMITVGILGIGLPVLIYSCCAVCAKVMVDSLRLAPDIETLKEYMHRESVVEDGDPSASLAKITSKPNVNLLYKNEKIGVSAPVFHRGSLASDLSQEGVFSGKKGPAHPILPGQGRDGSPLRRMGTKGLLDSLMKEVQLDKPVQERKDGVGRDDDDDVFEIPISENNQNQNHISPSPAVFDSRALPAHTEFIPYKPRQGSKGTKYFADLK